MFIYYDDQGNIHSISPVNEDTDYRVSVVDIGSVCEFINGTQDTARYFVSTDNNTVIIKKKEIAAPSFDASSHLSCSSNNADLADINIHTNTVLNTITVSVNSTLVTNENIHSESIKGLKSLQFHYVLHNDPHYLLYTVHIDSLELLTKKAIIFEYSKVLDLTSSTIFTKSSITHHSRITK